MVQPMAPNSPPRQTACHAVMPRACTSIQPASGMVTSLGIGMLALSSAMMTDHPRPADALQQGGQKLDDLVFDAVQTEPPIELKVERL